MLRRRPVYCRRPSSPGVDHDRSASSVYAMLESMEVELGQPPSSGIAIGEAEIEAPVTVEFHAPPVRWVERLKTRNRLAERCSIVYFLAGVYQIGEV
jgi:hypothetical protein